MNPSSPPLPSPVRRDPQIQGPRPTPLKVSKTSHQIRKPPRHPAPPLHPPENSISGEESLLLRRDPVIIYTVSPKIINATANEFMSIVQRLTGPSTAPSLAGDISPAAVSPAARFAAMEKSTNLSPLERERERDWAVEMGQFPPGVLSPSPASLAPIPAGFFSPAEIQTSHNNLWASDLGSPLWHNLLLPTPSPSSHALMVSPSSSSLDIFNLFDY